jgi:hypothetical protein
MAHFAETLHNGRELLVQVAGQAQNWLATVTVDPGLVASLVLGIALGLVALIVLTIFPGDARAPYAPTEGPLR